VNEVVSKILQIAKYQIVVSHGANYRDDMTFKVELVQEDVDVIGLSIHSGAHIYWTRKIVERLAERGLANEFILMVGGAIPEYDFEELRNLGVYGIFSPGTLPERIVSEFRESVSGEKMARLLGVQGKERITI
jgi:methylmalonyl-CoA mutase C-terminal domain/subunit